MEEQLLKITKREIPQGEDPSGKVSGRWALEIPKTSEALNELAIAALNLAAADSTFLNLVMNTAAGLVCNSNDPTGMLENFARVVRDNLTGPASGVQRPKS